MKKVILFIRLMMVKLSFRLKGARSIVFGGMQNISKNVTFELDPEAKVFFDRGVHLRSGVVVAVKKNAELSIGKGVFVNYNTIISSRKKIVIGDGTCIGPNVVIYDHDHNISEKGKYITDDVVIEGNVWIGANVVILKGVHIGMNSVVAAGSVVSKNIPNNVVFIQKRLSSNKEII